MKFDKAVPILYSQDFSKSVTYFIEQLKFENKWEWGNPPTFGGVYRDNVDEYYDLIKESGAKILSKPGTKEWSMREMLVECPDGHIIRFGHNTACDQAT